MKFISNIMDRGSDNKYAELTDADLTSANTNQTVAFVNVTKQEDIINAKEALNAGKILVIDISFIQSNGLSLEVVYGEIESCINANGGDIVHKENNDIIVATPRGINLSRQKI